MAETSAQRLEKQDKELFDEINKYIDELKGYAQGDYDFVVKFLKQNFEKALGTDDAERAKFFSSVSNQLEQRIGRIPFDYDLKTGREKEDLTSFLKQKDVEDTEQRKQEIEFTTQQELVSAKEKKVIGESASERGVLGSGIEKRQQAEAVEKRKTDVIDPQKRVFSYQQAIRDEQRRLGVQTSGRNIADITTGARRAGEDEQQTFDYGTEKADKTLAERLADIRRTESGEFRTGLQLQTTSSLDRFL